MEYLHFYKKCKRYQISFYGQRAMILNIVYSKNSLHLLLSLKWTFSAVDGDKVHLK